MTPGFKIELQEDIVTIKFAGGVRLFEIFEAIDIVSRYYQAKPRLWDLSAGIHLDPDQVRMIAKQGKVRFLKPSKAAIVIPNSVSLELTTIFEIFRADDFTENRVFRSKDEAVAWLQEPL